MNKIMLSEEGKVRQGALKWDAANRARALNNPGKPGEPKKVYKTAYCPCGSPSIGIRQGVACCARCEKREAKYWDGSAASNARLHGVSLLRVDEDERRADDEKS